MGLVVEPANRVALGGDLALEVAHQIRMVHLEVVLELLGLGVRAGGVDQCLGAEVAGLHQGVDDARVPVKGQLLEPVLVRDDALQQHLERVPGQRFLPLADQPHPVAGDAEQVVVLRVVVLEVGVLLVAGDFVERRLGDVDVALLNQLGHLPVEEGQQQGADVGAVDVGVGHDHDAVVANAFRLVFLFADPGAEGGDEGDQFLAGEHLLEAGLFDVQDLAAQREDRLVAAVAALLGGAACGIALHDEQLGFGRVLRLAVGQLSGQREAVEDALAAHRLAGLARGEAGPAGVGDLPDDLLRVGRVLVEPDRELLVHHLLDQALDFRVAQLGLGLALELGVGQLDRDDRGDAFPGVFTGGRFLEVLPLPALLGVAVDAAGERRLEADHVASTFDGVDVVREGEDPLVVAIVPLHRDFQPDVVLLGAEEDRFVVQLFLPAVEEVDERDQPALELEVVVLGGALVADGDVEAGVEEGQLAQPTGERLEVVLGDLEDGGVGLERDLGAALVGDPDLGHLLLGNALGVLLLVDLAAPLHLDRHPFREAVHARDAHAVQTAGDLVGAVLELPARVELGHHHVEGVHPVHGGVGATGMPRPLSVTVMLLSTWTMTSMSVQMPGSASCTELSTTS